MGKDELCLFPQVQRHITVGNQPALRETLTGTQFNQPSPQQSPSFVLLIFNIIKIPAQESRIQINHAVNTIK